MAESFSSFRNMPRVLIEMRPALDGFAGIPQETRLLFRALCLLNTIKVEGLIQTSLQFLSPGMPLKRETSTNSDEATRLDCYSRLAISLSLKPSRKRFEKILLYFKRRRSAYRLTLSTLLLDQQKVRTTFFETANFENFIWQLLFDKTLHPNDFSLVTSKDFRVCTVPWNIFQSVGLNTLRLISQPKYPELDTDDVDVFIAQTPFPARIGKNTTLVVRYHDALPIFMPHAFANKVRHQAAHYNALLSNVKSGAYFACVSESTRQDLLRIFPELERRSITIHNMVSHHYYEDDSLPSAVPTIVRSRLNLMDGNARHHFSLNSDMEAVYRSNLAGDPFRYLLMVSTIEPRKNHLQLIAAWKSIKLNIDPSLKLVLVGNLGWDVGPIIDEMRVSINDGAIFLLKGVPAAELRILYRHAAATICPSVAEGFDFSGVESMQSGGVVIASDIPVHHEIYADAARYFNTHSSSNLADEINTLVYSSEAPKLQEQLRKKGKDVASRYLPEKILPKWDAFLSSVICRKKMTGNLA